MADPVGIRSIEEIEAGPELIAQIDAIFLQSSNTHSFASEAERARLRERWLGRYLDRYPGDFLVARDAGGRVLGYLAGCPEDAARLPAFDDMAVFRAECARYPAHLHVNIHADARDRGLGRLLVAQYAAACTRRGIPGLHVVTAAGARNVRFYERCGFRLVGVRDVGRARLVLLGRDLGSPEAEPAP